MTKKSVVFDCIYRIRCAGDACEALVEYMLHREFPLVDVSRVACHAASTEGWMFVLRSAYCPRCAHGLQSSLLSGMRGPGAEAIKMGIVERAHLQRIQVEVSR